MPIKSTYPDVELQKTDIFSFLFNRKDRPFPESKVIFQDADETSRQYTYASIKSQSIDFAKGLKSIYDFSKGDVLSLFSPNDIDVVPVVFGTLWAGGVVSPANPAYTVDEFAFQLKDCGAKVIACHIASLPTAKAAAAKVGIPESNIFTIGSGRDPKFTIKTWESVRPLSGTSRYRQTKIDPENDLAFLVYSSGTTGKPKGVELTHLNMVSNIQQVQATEGGWLSWDGSKSCPGIPDAPKTGDKILACLPFFHIYGLNALIHNPLYTGVHVLVLARFEITKFCKLIQDHTVTFSYIVPPMVLLLCKHPAVDNYNLSSLRMTNSGAAPLTRELVDALFKRTGIRVKQGYGLSETSPTIFQQPWQEWNVGIGSTGKMVPNLLAKFCEVAPPDADASAEPKEVKEGEVGELYVKGPNVFKRYHNNPRASAECLDDEGWFRTGDVGYIDKNGDLWITDRVKELIKYKGFQVAPAELEGYLADHELIDDVAVVGVEDDDGGEVPRAYVVRKGGMKAVSDGDAEGIAKWLAGKVVSYKRLRGGVRFVESVPKSVSGKILRRVLKEEARKEQKAGRAKL
jgi:4-coumarate--CoA ligase